MTTPLRADPQIIKRYSPRQAKATCRTCGREWLGPRVLGVAAIRWGLAGSGGISPRCVPVALRLLVCRGVTTKAGRSYAGS